MRYLAASETVIDGGKRIEQILPVPEIKTFPASGGSKPEPTGPKFSAKDSQDVRVIAFKQPDAEANDIDMACVKASAPTLKPLEALLAASDKTSVKIGRKPEQIDFKLDGLLPAQSRRLEASKLRIAAQSHPKNDPLQKSSLLGPVRAMQAK